MEQRWDLPERARAFNEALISLVESKGTPPVWFLSIESASHEVMDVVDRLQMLTFQTASQAGVAREWERGGGGEAT